MPEDLIVNIEGMDIIVKDAKLKIGIGLSVGSNISPEFLKMLFARFAEWTRIYAVAMIIDATVPLDLSRNKVIEVSQRENCDYIFFIDSDVLIEQGQLETLLSHQKDAISGVYYQKRSPCSPLPRKRVSKNLYIAAEIQGNNIVEIDATGMGCFLLKMDIFRKIPYPWFEFKYHNHDNGRWVQVSEDFHFCQSLQNAGIKIYCDPNIQCSHVGGIIDPQMSEIYRRFRIDSANERNMIISELSEFVNISSSEIYDKWKFATEIVADDYRNFINQNHRDQKDFYKVNKNYIFDLTNFHMTQGRGFDVKLIDTIRKMSPVYSAWDVKKILDYGSGCGQNAIELAKAGHDVSIADYEGYTSEFARFRAKKRGLNIKFYDIEKPINDKFDIIFAFNVLEHIPDDQFKYVIDRLKSLRKNGGKILTCVSFDTQSGLHPMHYTLSQEKVGLINQLGTQSIDSI